MPITLMMEEIYIAIFIETCHKMYVQNNKFLDKYKIFNLASELMSRPS